MRASIGTRELIVLDDQGVVVRGTYHKCDEGSDFLGNAAGTDRIGVVFLNSLSPTRAGTGDSTVYWADALAGHGYPSFRLDLPGFGDSAGDPPPGLLEFLNTGRFAGITSAKIKELVGRFGLGGVVVVGLCAGAVSALYTAAASKECRGLVLLDPYFHLPLSAKSKLWEKITGRVSRTATGIFVSDVYDRLLAAAQARLRGGLPSNANFALLSVWKTVARTGMPILIFKASGVKMRGGEFDYHRYIIERAGRKSRVVTELIEGAGHTFSNRLGRAAVRQHTESWLTHYFPLASGNELTVSDLCFEHSDTAGKVRS